MTENQDTTIPAHTHNAEQFAMPSRPAASNWLEEQVLNHFFRGADIPSPTTFLALYISDPTENDIGTEIQGGAYNRMRINFGEPQQIDGKGTISNSEAVYFSTATENWGVISHWGIRDAQTGGNLLTYGAVPTPKLIERGDEAKFNVGAITVSMD